MGEERRDMRIYMARPFNGYMMDELIAYYDELSSRITEMGAVPVTPLTYASILAGRRPDNLVVPDALELTDQAIMRRSKWLVKGCHVILMDLSFETRPAVDSLFELAWAEEAGIHSLVILNRKGSSDHPFTRAAADIVFDVLEDVLTYLEGYLPAWNVRGM